ncbi:MAG: molybdopterin-binding protein [Fuerstiella sp.]|nr:molybdopterin-binding protein [Fuerstiella sp.]
MNAELIAIGSELVCGAGLDTNSQWLSQELEARGWTVTRHTTIADDLDAMVETLQLAARRCRIVLVTGGLGPTRDDITREAMSGAFNQPLVEDETELQYITGMFARLGRPMPDRNRIQAMRPRDATPLRNNHGTAPGVLLNVASPKCMIAAMPGVPGEMKKMFDEQLVAMLPKSSVFVRRVVLRTFGYGESHAEELLGNLTERGRNPEVGITASGAVISLSVTARADTELQCDTLIQPVINLINDKLSHAVYGTGSDELHLVVRRSLADRNLTVALAEGTTTGGLLSQWLVHDCADEGPVVRSDRLISGTENLDDLVQLCKTVQNDADYAIVTSHSVYRRNDDGFAVMHGQFAVTGPGLSRVVNVDFTGDLGIFRERAARMAINLIRLHINGHAVEPVVSGNTVR